MPCPYVEIRWNSGVHSVLPLGGSPRLKPCCQVLQQMPLPAQPVLGAFPTMAHSRENDLSRTFLAAATLKVSNRFNRADLSSHLLRRLRQADQKYRVKLASWERWLTPVMRQSVRPCLKTHRELKTLKRGCYVYIFTKRKGFWPVSGNWRASPAPHPATITTQLFRTSGLELFALFNSNQKWVSYL